ncbi:MAG: nucleotide sugar dehydrogenase [Bacteroidetes bacterium]|uniref:UDP-glucose 6-dehydrogenase n=1 Tax=Candidatus Enterocola intestinipullorum TaxID=2840783 RepID=A0A9D9EKC3_9BACT|nr:nucleotide sugar dehydrogenase [Candidatus Enterocola intestinipullorum]
MNISIFGLGYVGCVGMGCLAARGHNVVGVDVSEEKINLINSGMPTIVEKDIDHLIADAHNAGKIRATKDYKDAVKSTDISFLCVGTPSADNGHLNLEYIFQTAREIGEALKDKNGFHIIVIRSTVFPGTNAKVTRIISEISGKKADEDFAVVSNPEFLREGTAVHDYMNPPLTVLGSSCPAAIDTLKNLYSETNAPIEVVAINVAEMIKYVNNSYHALKVVFANEVGAICAALGIDSHEVMRIFCMDKQLNISPYYFKPGFAYGGSCLPKDLRGLKTLAHDLYLDTPVLNVIDDSNRKHITRCVMEIEKSGCRKIGFLGLSFKAGTDDMRNSPIVNVIEYLHGKGYDIEIFDKNVSLSRLIGKNKSVISEKLPHLDKMLKDDLQDVCCHAELLVISNKDEQFKTLQLRPGQKIFDLVRIKELESSPDYKGLCW